MFVNLRLLALKDARIHCESLQRSSSSDEDLLRACESFVVMSVSAEFTVLEARLSGLVWVQVWYAGMKLVVYAPPEMLCATESSLRRHCRLQFESTQRTGSRTSIDWTTLRL
jgi:hypothetical protein